MEVGLSGELSNSYEGSNENSSVGFTNNEVNNFITSIGTLGFTLRIGANSVTLVLNVGLCS